jgi:hypothetical protein
MPRSANASERRGCLGRGPEDAHAAKWARRADPGAVAASVADDSGVTCARVLNRTDPGALKNRETLAKYEQWSKVQTLLSK